jgi:hypothetical protein
MLLSPFHYRELTAQGGAKNFNFVMYVNVIGPVSMDYFLYRQAPNGHHIEPRFMFGVHIFTNNFHGLMRINPFSGFNHHIQKNPAWNH